MGWINFHRVGNEEEPETRFKVKSCGNMSN
jgi:hypothetical protein